MWLAKVLGKMFKRFPGATYWLLLFITSSSAFATTAKHPRKHQAAKAEPVITPARPPTPAALQQITLQQMPAMPAQVQYANKQLTITARNSTMSDILAQVKKLTGASMDFPPNAAERVVGQFGPGPAREVLASLLDGTNFNYVLLGSAKNPTGVDRVIVTVKPTGPEVSRPAQPNIAQQDESEQEGLGTADADQDQNLENPPPDDQAQQPSSDADQNAPQGPKTPEQLLQELQRQQQLQQQMLQRRQQTQQQ